MEAVSAGAGAAVVVGGVMRRYWRGREDRQQAQFRRAVQDIVDASISDVITRQASFEKSQGQHLDRQDKAIAELRRALELPRRRNTR